MKCTFYLLTVDFVMRQKPWVIENNSFWAICIIKQINFSDLRTFETCSVFLRWMSSSSIPSVTHAIPFQIWCIIWTAGANIATVARFPALNGRKEQLHFLVTSLNISFLVWLGVLAIRIQCLHRLSRIWGKSGNQRSLKTNGTNQWNL